MAKEIRWDKDKGYYVLSNHASIENAKKYIDSIALTNVVIRTEEDYKAVRTSRTLVNNEQKEIATARKQMTAVILSLFEPFLKEVENYANSKSNELTKMMNEFKPPKERERKSFKLEVTFDNPKALEKVKAYALKYGGKIKGETETNG